MKTAIVILSAALAFTSNSLVHGQTPVTRPDVSEEACPFEMIQPPTRDG